MYLLTKNPLTCYKYMFILVTYCTVCVQLSNTWLGGVRHVAGTGSGLLGGIPRVVVQISALTLKGPL